MFNKNGNIGLDDLLINELISEIIMDHYVHSGDNFLFLVISINNFFCDYIVESYDFFVLSKFMMLYQNMLTSIAFRLCLVVYMYHHINIYIYMYKLSIKTVLPLIL